LLVLSSLLSLFFSLVSLLRRPRPSSFFPYTTLFRSLGWNRLPGGLCPGGSHSLLLDIWYQQGLGGTQRRGGHPHPAFLQMGNDRSEERRVGKECRPRVATEAEKNRRRSKSRGKSGRR